MMKRIVESEAIAPQVAYKTQLNNALCPRVLKMPTHSRRIAHLTGSMTVRNEEEDGSQHNAEGYDADGRGVVVWMVVQVVRSIWRWDSRAVEVD
jgi:hypothetical protein